MNTDSRRNSPWTEAEWERFMREQRGRRPLAVAELRDATRPGRLGEATEHVTAIPAFQLTCDFARQLGSCPLPGEDPEATLAMLVELSHEARHIAEHVAAGHGLGYEDDHICGNIVRCRQALHHAGRSVALVERMRHGREGEDELDRLLGTAVFIRVALEERIASLRQRVWWDAAAAVS